MPQSENSNAGEGTPERAATVGHILVDSLSAGGTVALRARSQADLQRKRGTERTVRFAVEPQVRERSPLTSPERARSSAPGRLREPPQLLSIRASFRRPGSVAACCKRLGWSVEEYDISRGPDHDLARNAELWHQLVARCRGREFGALLMACPGSSFSRPGEHATIERPDLRSRTQQDGVQGLEER